MKRFLLSLTAGAVCSLAPSVAAADLAVGVVSDDICLSEGLMYNGSNYRLDQRSISDFSDRVLILIYASPW